MTSLATGALPRTSPDDVDVDPDGLTAFVDAVEASPELELHSLMLLRHGQVAAEACWAPYERDDATLLYSLSKSFTSTALGFAVAEGRLALADRVVDLLAPTGPVGPRTRAMTVRDLAAMATGHHEDTLERARRLDPVAVEQGFLALEPESDPGSVFAYNNTATYTLAAILQVLTGETLTAYLTPRLFAPLGVQPGSWDQHPEGRDVGFTGLHLSTEALARFGQLYLDDGMWQGRRVLPEGWAELATGAHTPTLDEPDPDWQQGYGFQFWRGRHGSVRGDGAFGQFCLLLPEQDAVLVLTAGNPNMQGVLDLVWAHLLPAFDRPGGVEADARLAERLTGLELRTDRRDPLAELVSEQIGVGRVTGAPGGWQLTLTEQGQAYGVAVGRDGWTRTDVLTGTDRGLTVAARGFEVDGTMTAEVVLVETPHRLRVVAGPDGSSVTWHPGPLFSPDRLAGLATPRP